MPNQVSPALACPFSVKSPSGGQRQHTSVGESAPVNPRQCLGSPVTERAAVPAAGAQSLNLVSLTFHVTQRLSHRRIWGGCSLVLQKIM